MMKRLNPWLVGVSLTFAGVVLGVSISKGVELGVLAEEGMEEVEVENVLSEDIQEQAANYYLPYPGVLPDHPLYFVKMIRDRVREWLTVGEGNKVRLWQLYADKRMRAAKALVEGGQRELGVKTAQKAVMYQERAVEMTGGLKKKGSDVGRMANSLEKATAKHEEVLQYVEAKVGDELRGGVGQMKGRVRQNRQQVLEILER